jgi:hypothetical protein
MLGRLFYPLEFHHVAEKRYGGSAAVFQQKYCTDASRQEQAAQHDKRFGTPRGANRIEFWASSAGDKTMRRYHHVGIPTSESKPGETHLKHLKVFVVSHEKSEFGVEWMRFEAGAAVPDLVRRVPHVAFEVTDLAAELAGREILIAPNSPSDGVRVAFIVENGAPIELLEFTDPKHPARLANQEKE